MTNEKTRALVAKAYDELAMLDLDGPTTAEGTAWGPCLREAKQALAEAVEALTAPDGDARPKVITEDGRHYAEFKGGDVIECSSPEDADATAEAWRRWPNGGHPPVDEHRGAWRTGFVDGAEWALSRAAAPEPDVITISRPVAPFGPTHVTENEATADYLGEVVRKIDGGYANVGGSNVTATVRKLLVDAADALRALPVGGERGGREV